MWLHRSAPFRLTCDGILNASRTETPGRQKALRGPSTFWWPRSTRNVRGEYADLGLDDFWPEGGGGRAPPYRSGSLSPHCHNSNNTEQAPPLPRLCQHQAKRQNRRHPRSNRTACGWDYCSRTNTSTVAIGMPCPLQYHVPTQPRLSSSSHPKNTATPRASQGSGLGLLALPPTCVDHLLGIAICHEL